MIFLTKLTELITAMKAETKSIRTLISGTSDGTVAGLNTTATNLVGAINEVQANAGATIDDLTPNVTTTYSSTKITADIAAAQAVTQAAAVTQAKAEILDGAAAEVDTLVEIAAQLSANTTSDAALAAVVANKANSADVYVKADFGDITTDLVAIWNAA